MEKYVIDSEAWDLQDGKAGKCLRSPHSQERSNRNWIVKNKPYLCNA